MLGAISLSSSSHLPPISPSVKTKPVIFPPGRERLSTKPSPTGSETAPNTIGIRPVVVTLGRVAALRLLTLTLSLSLTWRGTFFEPVYAISKPLRRRSIAIVFGQIVRRLQRPGVNIRSTPSALRRCIQGLPDAGYIDGETLRGFTGENRTKEAASVQHPAFYKYRESYPRKSGSPRNCCSRAGDERIAVPVCV
jgi:hypothetical protein